MEPVISPIGLRLKMGVGILPVLQREVFVIQCQPLQS